MTGRAVCRGRWVRVVPLLACCPPSQWDARDRAGPVHWHSPHSGWHRSDWQQAQVAVNFKLIQLKF